MQSSVIVKSHPVHYGIHSLLSGYEFLVVKANSVSAAMAFIVHGFLQNQNLRRLSDLALLHLSRCVD
jgi:hypothetical protein